MRIAGAHVVAAVLVGVLTVLAPNGAFDPPEQSGSVDARANAADVVSSPADRMGMVAARADGSAVPISAQGSAGTVMVSVVIVDPTAPAPPSSPVYRFYNTVTDTHFYTFSEVERQHVIATWPDIFRFEGVSYYVNPATDTSPLYRFYNMRTNTHFYTASEEEKAKVIATWPHIFRYEGVAYGVSRIPMPGKLTVYRFFNLRSGTHFYTASQAERDHIIAVFPTYRYEGISFWVGP